MSKKLILGIFIGALFFTSLFSTARASFIQDAAGTGSAAGGSFWTKFSQSVNAPGTDVVSWTGWSIQSILAHSIAILGGYPDANGNVSLVSIDDSAIGGISKMIGLTYQQPISSKEYLAYVSRNLNIATPVYAQGQGWTFLRPILDIWIVIRNLIYLFFVVIFVAIGFMIMFRAKLDPQTVISIQTALPKIIVSLVLVTFSYAISGLIVDLAFLLNGLVNSIFLAPGGLILPKLAAFGLTQITSVNPDRIINIFWGGLTAGGVMGLLGLGLIGIFGLIIVVSSFKLFFALLGKYITLIFGVVLAPLAFLFGALPGQGMTGSWLKTMLGAALSFPATYLVLNLAIYFMTLGQPGQPQYLPVPPFTLDYFPAPAVPGPGVPIPPVAALPTSSRLVGLGIFLLATKIPEILDSMFKAEGPAAAAGAVGPELQGALRKVPFIGGLMG